VQHIAAHGNELCPPCWDVRAKALRQRIFSDLYICGREAARALETLDLSQYERDLLRQTIATLQNVRSRRSAQRAVNAARARIERVNNAHLRSAGSARIRRNIEGLPQLQPFAAPSPQLAA
jgi:hypothetical protein